MKQTKRAIGYTRVSTQEQAEHGVSLEAQAAKVRAYAELHDLELVDVVTDAGISGKGLNRPGLSRVLELARRGKVDAVIVTKLDRLSRRTVDILGLVEGVFSRTELHSITDKLDTGTAAGRFVVTVLAGLAQMEREQIGERTAAALAHKRERREYCGGGVPFGYRLGADGTLEAHADEQEATAIIAELRADGMSYRAIARELRSMGITAKNGGEWSPIQVSRVCARVAA